MFDLQHSKSKSRPKQKTLALTQLFKIDKPFLSDTFHNRREKNSKSAKEIKNSSPDYHKKNYLLNELQKFFKDLNSDYFFLK